MNYRLTILFFFFTPLIFGQTNTFHHFPDSNATWRVNWSTSDCFVNGYNETRYQYFFSGDTTISSLTYKKVFRDGACNPPCCLPIFNPYTGFVGSFREDTLNKKVFLILADSTSESLLYDFNLSIGDTIKGLLAALQPNIIVSSIDSILVGNSFYRKLNFNYIDGVNSIIEGIGSTQGLIEPLFTFDAAGILVCFERNDSILFTNINTFDSCNILTNLTNHHPIYNNVILFPNPATNELTADFTIPDKFVFELYDLIGTKRLSARLDSNSKTVDLTSVDSGVYVLTIVDSKEDLIKTDKLIIIK